MLLTPRTAGPITARALDFSVEPEQQSLTVGVVSNGRESMRKARGRGNPIAIDGPPTGINDKQLGANRSSEIDLLLDVLLIHPRGYRRIASHMRGDKTLVARHCVLNAVRSFELSGRNHRFADVVVHRLH